MDTNANRVTETIGFGEGNLFEIRGIYACVPVRGGKKHVRTVYLSRMLGSLYDGDLEVGVPCATGDPILEMTADQAETFALRLLSVARKMQRRNALQD